MKRLLPTLATLAALLCASSATASELTFAPRVAVPHAAAPPSPPAGLYPLQLMLDDNTDEGAFGFTSGQNAQQFMWFNRFTVPSGNYLLQQIWVLFPSNQNISVGANIELAIYIDSDSNPANGATLVATLNETVQAADDVNFSIYTLTQPLQLSQSSDVLIGVIPRLIVAGTTPPTNPAAVDTTASQGRSWVAIWTGDPPDPPTLPPDVLIARLDDGLQPGGGNWMIRAFGAPVGPAASVPAVSVPLLALLSIALGAFGVLFQRRAAGLRLLTRRPPGK
jgi:hypothetical protein